MLSYHQRFMTTHRHPIQSHQFSVSASMHAEKSFQIFSLPVREKYTFEI